MNMTGNTILITGGTSGIGLGFAEAFLQLRNRVIICGRRKERLAEIQAQHPDIVTRFCDITDEYERAALSAWVQRDFPALNVLVNNAGVQLTSDLANPANVARMRTELETNVVAPLHLTALLTSQLTSQPAAAVINITSGLAFVPIARLAVYCASKAALHSATLSLRHVLRKTSVRVFDMIPPAVDTELGRENRPAGAASHGGMPVSEFIAEAMAAIEKDRYEYAVGTAKNLREKGETLFPILNSPE